jgi:hypothetical protein
LNKPEKTPDIVKQSLQYRVFCALFAIEMLCREHGDLTPAVVCGGVEGDEFTVEDEVR